MDLETGAICSIVYRADREPAVFIDAIAAGMDETLFVGKGLPVWQFLVDYNRDHGGVPPEDVVRRHFPKFLPPEDVPAERPAEVSYYIDELKKRRLHNKIAAAMKQGSDLLQAKDPLGALAAYEQMVVEAQEDTKGAQDVNLQETARARLDRYNAIREAEGILGIPFPWEPLTQITQGLQKGQLITITARPGVGKSWVASMIANCAYDYGFVPYIDSREMAVEEFSRRIDALRAKVPHASIRSGDLSSEQLGRYEKVVVDFEEIKQPYWVSGAEGAQGVTALAAKIERLKPDIVIIDGLYLMRDDRGETGWEGIANITRDLKRLAKQKEIPIVVTTQLNRRAKKRGADLSELAFGDSIGQDSDLVIALFQDDDLRNEQKLLIKLIKQREGFQLEMYVKWDLARMEFEVLDDSGYLPDQEFEDDDDFDQAAVLGFTTTPEAEQ